MVMQSCYNGDSDHGLRGVVAVDGDAQAAAGWARLLGCEVLATPPSTGEGVVINVTADAPPALQLLGRRPPGPVAIDFTAATLHRRLAGTRVRHDPLTRAVGLHRQPRLRIVDATAGLGRDGWILAASGAEVAWIERSRTLAALLAAALERAAAHPTLAPIVARLTLYPGELCEQLSHFRAPPPEVVYLDPMYPTGAMRGGVGREAQVLRGLIGDAGDDDDTALLAAALACASRRVVVKRPLRAAPLSGPPPTRSVKGRALRFDVYELAHFAGRPTRPADGP